MVYYSLDKVCYSLDECENQFLLQSSCSANGATVFYCY